ncbi:sulfotransferase [Desulfomonile tiedjei]|uniref:Sulfotransferase family protein n=1 Tax=Desulfomonile tiedjei (strain ATCC 49306 / DSM 6799 / DCB-1) TaxID=706587 RepID=I4C000_DESTA|nr:sulfotransferase [Desulfomonile tiedjei]AFM22891.1 hypothetical protein Desti_0145 [Desulfomonile tiedjei DSM 6799]
MDFRLLMLSAMYENGGNTVHRFLDGHPQMYVYPFESQVGTHLVHDHLTSMFPVKYRWPVFDLEASPVQDYRSIIDEECKVRARTPKVSKFRHMAFAMSDDERCELFVRNVSGHPRSTGGNMAAFFRATFEAWKDYSRSGEEQVYVGYSPIIAVDAEKILRDVPEGIVVHVVRNPWSAYADTKKRPVPMPLFKYITAWTVTQYHALVFKSLFPDRFFIVRYEDVIENPAKILGNICNKIGLKAATSLEQPTWNGNTLEEVYPWGTIRKASPQVNRATAEELSAEEIDRIRTWAGPYPAILEYSKFLD